ncbi:MAG: hypothetical protein AAFO07_12515 [Bacteroidota bacterium]
MQSFLLYLPILFFMLALYFRLSENSAGLFRKYNIVYDPSKNQMGIRMKTIKLSIQSSMHRQLTAALKICLIKRRAFYFFLLLAFLSGILIGFLKQV